MQVKQLECFASNCGIATNSEIGMGPSPTSTSRIRPDLELGSSSRIWIDASTIYVGAPSHRAKKVYSLVRGRCDRKTRKYALKAQEIGAIFYPFIVTSNGQLCDEATKLIYRIPTMGKYEGNFSESIRASNAEFQAMSVTIQRGNAVPRVLSYGVTVALNHGTLS